MKSQDYYMQLILMIGGGVTIHGAQRAGRHCEERSDAAIQTIIMHPERVYKLDCFAPLAITTGLVIHEQVFSAVAGASIKNA